LEWARVETGGAKEWVLERREFLGLARVTYQGNFRILGIPPISFE